MLENAGNVDNVSFVNLFPIGVDEKTLAILKRLYLSIYVDETILCCRTLVMLTMFHLSIYFR